MPGHPRGQCYDKSVNYEEDRAEDFQVTVFVGEEWVWATVRVGQAGRDILPDFCWQIAQWDITC